MGKNKKIKKESAKEKWTDRTKDIKRAGIPPLQVLSREDYLTAIILSTLTFVVYALTAAPGVTLADSGDFIMGVFTLGIVHAPGFPLYTLLGHVFSLLPFGEPAFRVNLFSALWGALCLGVMFLILRILSVERIHAVFATLFLGFTTVYWSQTGVAEVYSFNAFLIACIFFWILSYNRDKKKSQLNLIFLSTGLALSNHYPLVILTGVGLVFLIDRRDLHAADLAKAFLFLVLGLIPYLYLFIQASNPELQYNFGKLSDSSMVLDHILRKYYPNRYGGTVWDKFVLAFAFLKLILTNYLFSSFFLFLGVAYSFLEKWKYRYPLLIAALFPSLGLIAILTFPSDEKRMALVAFFSIPPFLFLSTFLALGLRKTMERYVENNIVKLSLLVILFLSQVGFNFQSSSYHKEQLAEIWGTELLNSLEPDAILVLCSKEALPIYYLQFVKGIRQDVTLYDRYSSFTKDNLYGPKLLFKRLDWAEYRKRRDRELIKNSPRPIYYSCKEAVDEGKHDFALTPFVYRVDARGFEASNATGLTVSNRLLVSLLNAYPESDYWLDFTRRTIFGALISYYGGHNRPEINRVLDYFMKTKYYSDPEFNLSMANNLYYFKNYNLAGDFYARAEGLSSEDFSPKDLAFFCYSLSNAKKYDKALPVCMRWEEQFSARCEGNTIATRQTIAGIYKEQGNWAGVAEYSKKILRCKPNHKIAQRYLMMAKDRAN